MGLITKDDFDHDIRKLSLGRLPPKDVYNRRKLNSKDKIKGSDELLIEMMNWDTYTHITLGYFPPKFVRHFFARYNKRREAYLRNYNGLGLGLSVAVQLALLSYVWRQARD